MGLPYTLFTFTTNAVTKCKVSKGKCVEKTHHDIRRGITAGQIGTFTRGSNLVRPSWRSAGHKKMEHCHLGVMRMAPLFIRRLVTPNDHHLLPAIHCHHGFSFYDLHLWSLGNGMLQERRPWTNYARGREEYDLLIWCWWLAVYKKDPYEENTLWTANTTIYIYEDTWYV